MNDEMWVLDATHADPTYDDLGMYPFCPLEGDPAGEFKVVVGLTFVSDKPPGRFVGVVHQDGPVAAEAWTEAHADYLEQAFGAENES